MLTPKETADLLKELNALAQKAANESEAFQQELNPDLAAAIKENKLTPEQLKQLAEAVKDAATGEGAIVLGNGYGGFVALQMAIRHPGIAQKLILADCGAAFSEPGREAFRNMASASSAKGLAAITDVAMRRLFAPEFQAAHPDLMQHRREAFLRRWHEVHGPLVREHAAVCATTGDASAASDSGYSPWAKR